MQKLLSLITSPFAAYNTINLDQHELESELKSVRADHIDEPQFMEIVKQHPYGRIKEIEKVIRYKDRDRTNSLLKKEITSAMMKAYPQELKGKSLIKVLRPYTSLQDSKNVHYMPLIKKMKIALLERMQEDRSNSRSRMLSPKHSLSLSRRPSENLNPNRVRSPSPSAELITPS